MQPTQPLGPAPVEFPMQSEVRINNIAVSANLRGIKKKEGTVMPPNVGATKNSFGILALDLATSARNTVDLVYINTEKVCAASLRLCRYHSFVFSLADHKRRGSSSWSVLCNITLRKIS